MMDPLLIHYIHNYDPTYRPVHCTNCGQARVSGNPYNPRVHCAAGHGEEIELVRMLRASHPASFRRAKAGKGFEGMDE